MVLLQSGAELTMLAPKEMSIFSGCSTVAPGTSMVCWPMVTVPLGKVYLPVSSRSPNMKVPMFCDTTGCSTSASSKPLSFNPNFVLASGTMPSMMRSTLTPEMVLKP